MILLLDVDNTVCAPKCKISAKMQKLLEKFKDVYFVSGSPYAVVKEQIGDCKNSGIFADMGNTLNGAFLTKRQDIDVKSTFLFQVKKRRRSLYLDFSFGDREKCIERFRESDPRWYICKVLSEKYPYQFTIGGQVSIDVTINGKEQAVKYIAKKHKQKPIVIGDRFGKWGNDEAMRKGSLKAICVKNQSDAYNKIRKLLCT